MKNVFFGFSLIWSMFTIAQSYSVSDTLKILSKSTDFGILHDFIQIENNSGQDLNMRWIQRFDAGFPSSWIPSIQDPDNWYNPCDTIDSADFVLKINPGSGNKMVIGLDHQNSVGAGVVYYTLFPVSNRSDSTTIAFSINISEGTGVTSISKQLSKDTFEIFIFPNPTNGQFLISGLIIGDELSIHDITGQLIEYKIHNIYIVIKTI